MIGYNCHFSRQMWNSLFLMYEWVLIADLELTIGIGKEEILWKPIWMCFAQRDVLNISWLSKQAASKCVQGFDFEFYRLTFFKPFGNLNSQCLLTPLGPEVLLKSRNFKAMLVFPRPTKEGAADKSDSLQGSLKDRFHQTVERSSERGASLKCKGSEERVVFALF